MIERRSFVVEWVPPTLNYLLRAHWKRRYKTTHTAGLHIGLAIGQCKTDPPERLRVIVRMHRTRQVDDDNNVAICKPIFDAIKRLGWAKDDSPRFMEQKVLPMVVCKRGEKPHTEITIEEVAARR
jgi:hypothetical protein